MIEFFQRIKALYLPIALRFAMRFTLYLSGGLTLRLMTVENLPMNLKIHLKTLQNHYIYNKNTLISLDVLYITHAPIPNFFCDFIFIEFPFEINKRFLLISLFVLVTFDIELGCTCSVFYF